MSLRLVAALCVMAACTMCGRAMAMSAERRYRFLLDTLHAIRALQIQIVHLLEPLERALRQTEFALFVRMAEKLAANVSAADAWREARNAERYNTTEYLADEEMRCLDRMFEQLGRSGREAQEEAMAVCLSALESAMTDAQNRAKQVSKLYTSLGFLSGLSIVILII